MTAGWYPYATVAPSPNYQEGRAAKINAVVLHVCQGTYQNSVDWLRLATTQSSAHFVLGKSGQVSQLVSIFDTAWGNGLRFENGQCVSPEGHVVHPTWPLLQVGQNPNVSTCSVEHEGFSGEPWTPEMDAANTRLLRWISDQTGLTYTPKTTLIGHCDISPVDRPECPGSTVDYWHVAASANLPSGQGSYLVSVPVANVRSGPARSYAVLSQRTQGSPILGDTWVLGESIGGDGRWLHRPSGQGFMHASVIQKV